MKYKELKTVYSTVKESTEVLSSPQMVADIVRERVGADEREHFIVLMLSQKNMLKSFYVATIGTVSETMVHPREIFRAAIATGASTIILAHNHPSGNTTPSAEDLATNKRMCEAGVILGINVLDHVIVGDGFKSLKEEGYMR